MEGHASRTSTTHAHAKTENEAVVQKVFKNCQFKIGNASITRPVVVGTEEAIALRFAKALFEKAALGLAP